VSELKTDDHNGSYTDVRIPITSRYYITLHNLYRQLKEIIHYLPNQRKNRIMLDLGCGNKPYQSIFSNQYSSYIGVDINSRSLADIIASGENLPFKDEVFDLCICILTYEHLIDPEQVTCEVCRVLKEDGLLVLTAHAVAAVHNYPRDYWRWTDQGLRAMLSKCFSNIVIHELTTPIETISQLAVTYLPVGKLGTVCSVLVNRLATSIGKSSINTRLPRLIGSYLAVAGKKWNYQHDA